MRRFRLRSSATSLLAAVGVAIGANAAPAHAATERPIVYLVVVDGLDGDHPGWHAAGERVDERGSYSKAATKRLDLRRAC